MGQELPAWDEAWLAEIKREAEQRRRTEARKSNPQAIAAAAAKARKAFRR